MKTDAFKHAVGSVFFCFWNPSIVIKQCGVNLTLAMINLIAYIKWSKKINTNKLFTCLTEINKKFMEEMKIDQKKTKNICQKKLKSIYILFETNVYVCDRSILTSEWHCRQPNWHFSILIYLIHFEEPILIIQNWIFLKASSVLFRRFFSEGTRERVNFFFVGKPGIQFILFQKKSVWDQIWNRVKQSTYKRNQSELNETIFGLNFFQQSVFDRKKIKNSC